MRWFKILQIFIFLIVGISLTACRSYDLYSDYPDIKVYTSLNKALKNKEDVKILHLTGQGLETFPKEILELHELQVLNLYNNNIKSLPPDIDRLQKLDRLEMFRNNLKELPHSMVNMTNLKRLNVGFNELSESDVVFLKNAIPGIFIISEIIL